MKDEGRRHQEIRPSPELRRGYYEVGACLGTFQEAGISALSHVAALVRVALEPCSMKEIAFHCEICTAAATQVVGNLVRLGLVSRQSTPDDRRVCLVALTDKGRELMNSAWDQVTAEGRTLS